MKYKMAFFCLVSLFFIGCKKEMSKDEFKVQTSVTVDSDSSSVVDKHNSQIALDWSGTYSGVIPCADCEGIETEIILKEDMTFIRRTRYLGKGDQTINEETGSFVWDKTGAIVSLKGTNDGPNQYKVGENMLFQLDMNGQRITGSLADNYILKK